jgi:hypothetical protein
LPLRSPNSLIRRAKCVWMTKPWDTRISDATSDEIWELANASTKAEMIQLFLGKGKGKGRYASAGKGPTAVGKSKGKGSAIQTNCRCCGVWGHSKKECMHWAKTCHTCGKKGHLAHVCTQEVERPPKDQWSRTPGAAPASYAAVVKSGQARICATCDNLVTADVNCCQRPGCKGSGKAAGKANSKGSKPDHAAPTPKGGPVLAADGDPTARERRIAKYKLWIAEGKEEGMDVTSLEEEMKKLCILQPTPLSETLAAKNVLANKANSLRQQGHYCKMIKEAEEEYQVRATGIITKRISAINETEEAHKAKLAQIDLLYANLEVEAKKQHLLTVENHKVKLARHNADLEKIEADAAPDAQEKGDTQVAAPAATTEMETEDEFAGINWPTKLDAAGVAAMAAFLEGQMKRIEDQQAKEKEKMEKEAEAKEKEKRDGDDHDDDEPDPKRAR